MQETTQIQFLHRIGKCKVCTFSKNYAIDFHSGQSKAGFLKETLVFRALHIFLTCGPCEAQSWLTVLHARDMSRVICHVSRSRFMCLRFMCVTRVYVIASCTRVATIIMTLGTVWVVHASWWAITLLNEHIWKRKVK